MFDPQKPNPKKQMSLEAFLKIRLGVILTLSALAVWLFIANQSTLAVHANAVVTTPYGFSFLSKTGNIRPDIFLIIGGFAFSTRLVLLCFVIFTFARLSPKRLLKKALEKQGMTHVTGTKRTVIISNGKVVSTKDEQTESEIDLSKVDFSKITFKKRT